MHAQIAPKITAFAIAVILNSLMILGVGYLSRPVSHECRESTASVDGSAHLPEPIRV